MPSCNSQRHHTLAPARHLVLPLLKHPLRGAAPVAVPCPLNATTPKDPPAPHQRRPQHAEAHTSACRNQLISPCRPYQYSAVPLHKTLLDIYKASVHSSALLVGQRMMYEKSSMDADVLDESELALWCWR
ncbi:hypothetical protein BDA96_06G053300 [Sorghum bicolor]|uniref:Uncharacterized protein n=1 Tax=Sorghum bicolor TaxID=4558 RepID=A0A921UBD3_SORBI|nr:hypothetical protein BDA96_06G053300 [Sorghum bicolor]